MDEQIFNLVAARKGHFRLESNHHGDLWLDLSLLCHDPTKVRLLAVQLAQQLKRYRCHGVCGPLVEGGFVALLVAIELEVEFFYSEPVTCRHSSELYPVEYRIPGPLRRDLRGKRIAIANDVINAGSSVRGTFQDLVRCGAQPVAIGALLILGDAIGKFAGAHELAIESLTSVPNNLWTPAECPLCASGVPLEDPTI